ncbi:MAG: DeoR family transcriptional regulator [Candidatus Dojkabacteria bacterium]
MKKILLVLALILSGGLAIFFFSDFDKNSKKVKKVLKSTKKYVEDTIDSVEDNGFGEMGWSDLDWTNKEIISKKAEQLEKVKPVRDLKAYLAKVDHAIEQAGKPVKKAVADISKDVKKTEKKIKKKVAALNVVSELNERQDKILSILNSKRKMNMTEMASEFVDVTSRTLRRDMEKLEKMKIIRQVGKTRDSFYELLKF